MIFLRNSANVSILFELCLGLGPSSYQDEDTVNFPPSLCAIHNFTVLHIHIVGRLPQSLYVQHNKREQKLRLLRWGRRKKERKWRSLWSSFPHSLFLSYFFNIPFLPPLILISLSHSSLLAIHSLFAFPISYMDAAKLQSKPLKRESAPAPAKEDSDDKKKKKKGSSATRCCQADRCTVDLSDAKQYHKRHRVCEFHSKAQVVLVSAIRQRFCQQCSRSLCSSAYQ